MKTGLLFDLDGTLFDTLEDLADSVNYAMDRFGYPRRTLPEIRRFVGDGIGMLIARAVPEGADPMPVLEVFREFYQEHCRIKTAPYPGIMASLNALKEHYPVAVVSNKADPAVKALCADYFPGVYALGECADCPRKPAPDMVYKAMAAIGVENCIYIGDSEVDVVTAKNAGVTCLSVLWGFRDEEELRDAGAEYFCAAPENLPEVVEMLDAKLKI